MLKCLQTFRDRSILHSNVFPVNFMVPIACHTLSTSSSLRKMKGMGIFYQSMSYLKTAQQNGCTISIFQINKSQQLEVTWKAKCVRWMPKARGSASCWNPEESSYPKLIAMALQTPATTSRLVTSKRAVWKLKCISVSSDTPRYVDQRSHLDSWTEVGHIPLDFIRDLQ